MVGTILPGKSYEILLLLISYSLVLCICRQMLLYDNCDSGWHMYCLPVVLQAVPAGDWYCPDCDDSPLEEPSADGSDSDRDSDTQ